MPRPQTMWLPVNEVRLRLASPMRGKPWAHKALFGLGRQAQSPKPPPPASDRHIPMAGGGKNCGLGGSNPIAKNCGKIAGKLRKIAENCGKIAEKLRCRKRPS